MLLYRTIALLTALVLLPSCHTPGRSLETTRHTTTTAPSLQRAIRDNSPDIGPTLSRESIHLVKFSPTKRGLHIKPDGNYASPQLDGRTYTKLQTLIICNLDDPSVERRIHSGLRRYCATYGITLTNLDRLPTPVDSPPGAAPGNLCLMATLNPAPGNNIDTSLTLADSATGIVLGRCRSTFHHDPASWLETYIDSGHTRPGIYHTRHNVHLIRREIAVPPSPLQFFYYSWGGTHTEKTSSCLPPRQTAPPRGKTDRPLLLKHIKSHHNRIVTASRYHSRYRQQHLTPPREIISSDTDLCFQKLVNVRRPRNRVITLDSPYGLCPGVTSRAYTSVRISCIGYDTQDIKASDIARQAARTVRKEWPGIPVVIDPQPRHRKNPRIPAPGEILLTLDFKPHNFKLIPPRPFIITLSSSGSDIPWGYAHVRDYKYSQLTGITPGLTKLLRFMEGRGHPEGLYSQTTCIVNRIDWSSYLLFYTRQYNTIKTINTYLKP